MSNHRTPIRELVLTSSPNLRRALKREQRENAPLTLTQKSELAKIDELISMALSACRRGQTIHRKRNPAFANLVALVKLRKMLGEGHDPDNKSGAEILAEADAFLKEAN